ncbi:MAG: Ferrous iron transport protein B [Bacteroidetes bacterium 38_7]|nr:MAG: Ferrous iron transport protein B [Bacteroidetes bacterium 38_7]HAL64535.1 ferrous iron transport protein B [Bacteroidales bacterium]
MCTLEDLKEGETGVIARVKGKGAFRRRIMDMGFIPGQEITVVRRAPLQDPVEYSIMGYLVSIRRSEARLIEILEDERIERENGHIPLTQKLPADHVENGSLKKQRWKTIQIALVGNPNAGKTTIFNCLSGLRERVGNYSGVTIDAKTAIISYKDYRLEITDLPGTYSLSSYSPEEVFVRNHILQEMPDVIVNIVDATNLERNLYLTTQLIDMDIRLVMALNMYDELQQQGRKINHQMLGNLLGFPVVPTIGKSGKGINELLDMVISMFEGKYSSERHIHINYGTEIEKSIRNIQSKIRIPENDFLSNIVSTRFLAIKLLEGDQEEISRIRQCKNYKEILSVVGEEIKKLESLTGDTVESAITDAKYGFIDGALLETISGQLVDKRKLTQKLDAIFTHKWLGLPIFAFILWLMFEATFSLGKYPEQWIGDGVSLLSSWITGLMQPGMLRDLLADGIIKGIGGVIVFLPNIVLLYLFIALMEDTGYMARVVFITDKLMHKIGLHGKSFIPMMMGFGCSVPAIMATRTIEDRKDRLVTMLIIPFMSCSARLPVYVLIVSAFFPQHSGSVLFLMYVIGMVVAIATAFLLKKSALKGQQLPFVMELPPYRIPTYKVVLLHMWDRAVQYLKKVAGIILVASIIIWALGYFPVQTQAEQAYQQRKLELEKISLQNPKQNEEIKDELVKLRRNYLLEKQESSYIGRLGKLIQPVMSPLGFDWKMSVSILAGIPGKEIVVSTMAVLYNQYEVESGNKVILTEQLQKEVYRSGPKAGQAVFSPLVALSFMIFVLLYFPCLSTIAVIKYESGSIKWGIFAIVFTTLVAWLFSFLVFQVGSAIL